MTWTWNKTWLWFYLPNSWSICRNELEALLPFISAVSHVANWAVTMAFTGIDLMLRPVACVLRCSLFFTFRPRVDADLETLCHLWLTILHIPQLCQNDYISVILKLLPWLVAVSANTFGQLGLAIHTDFDGFCPSWDMYEALFNSSFMPCIDTLSLGNVLILIVHIIM